MRRRVLGTVVPVVMLVVLCSVVAGLVATVVVSSAGIRDEDGQLYVFAVIFLVALVAGLVRLPLGKRS